ncbi:MAG: type transporter [Bacteroidetes bacterium]|nr:type transporter [Bacteroidota bacterium]
MRLVLQSEIKKLQVNCKETFHIFLNELKVVSRDRGVVVIFILAVLAYPLLYNVVYKQETLSKLPVAVVDNALCHESTEFVRHLNATPELNVYGTYPTLSEAREAFALRQVHGIIYIPSDFARNVNTGQKATLSVYCDMSSFLYYRTVLQGTNHVVLDLGKNIQLKRLSEQGIAGEAAQIIAEPVPYNDVVLFNETGGYSSFLVPAVLILILYQTLFFGITILAGTAREENRFHVLVNTSEHKGKILRVVLGKSAAYFMIYLAWSIYVLKVIPVLFQLPHIGNSIDLIGLIIPFLIASIFFSMTISVFLPNRETGMLIFGIFSLILLFLGGVSWPLSNMPGFWRAFGWIFPSTHGIQGYIKINSLGADIQTISSEYHSLWIQTVIYLFLCVWAYHWQIKKSSAKARLRQMASRKKELTIDKTAPLTNSKKDHTPEA